MPPRGRPLGAERDRERINFDRTGTTGIGKFVLNHSFMVPGLVATATSVAVGFLLIRFMF